MSRVGKKPIKLPAGVSVDISGRMVSVKGVKGELVRILPYAIRVEQVGQDIVLSPSGGDRKVSALWGLSRSLVANMVEGVTKGFEKKLEFEGIGYRVTLDANALVFLLGFSHPVRFETPAGITLKVEKNVITVSGIDKESVGETAARIRSLKPPEPYKGKGIRYRGEVIRRKAGKKAVTGR